MRNIILTLSLLFIGFPAFAASHNYTITSDTTFSLPNTHVLHYMDPGGNDACNGTSPSLGSSGNCAWLTTNHAMSCGDVIIAATGNYAVQQSWGTVSNCPSTTGGIDGTGGIYFAVLLCGGASVGDCKVNHSTGHDFAMDVNASNWAIEGWQVSEGYVNGAQGFGFTINTSANTGVKHHIAWVNNIANFNGCGFTVNSQGANSGRGFGADYWAIIGNIAQDSAGRNDGFYDGAIDIIGISNFDTTAGTHILVAGNFSYNNQQTTGGASDGESFLLDTPDALNYTQQIVFKNNIFFLSERFGFQIFYQNESVNTGMPLKIYNNTSFAGNKGAFTNDGPGGNYGDINLQANAALPWTVSITNNISKTNWAVQQNAGAGRLYALLVSSNVTTSNLTVGGSGPQNIFKGLQTNCSSSCDGGDNVVTFSASNTLGTNTYTDPLFNNTTDLLANQTGTPNCSGFETTVACMGWNWASQTATNPSIIYDLTATCVGCAGKGYQPPPSSCAADSDFPTFLKGIVYLHWTGSIVQQKAGLISAPCGQ